jgi:16S rRNA (guanine966-N2)-methyltransferase
MAWLDERIRRRRGTRVRGAPVDSGAKRTRHCRGSRLRVIAGTLGGRRFDAPRGRATRPTSDRVREALFMSLEPLAGLRVVDLYAGSGALGIEALSRGAEHVDFVEDDRATLVTLRANLTALALTERSRVWPLRLPGGLARLAARLADADLVLADPPYGGEDARGVLAALGRGGVLGAHARLVVEHHGKDDLPERCGALQRSRTRRYGETVVSIYRRVESAADPRRQEEGR